MDDLTKKGEEIHQIMQHNFSVLNEIKEANDFSLMTQDSEAWVDYMKYVNGIVSKALLGSIENLLLSLSHQVVTPSSGGRVWGG